MPPLFFFGSSLSFWYKGSAKLAFSVRFQENLTKIVFKRDWHPIFDLPIAIKEPSLTTMSKACVILGAGASHDVHCPGTRLLNPSLKPPLAETLFDIEKNNDFARVMQHYPNAKTLTTMITTRMLSENIGLEESLAYFAFHKK